MKLVHVVRQPAGAGGPGARTGQARAAARGGRAASPRRLAVALALGLGLATGIAMRVQRTHQRGAVIGEAPRGRRGQFPMQALHEVAGVVERHRHHRRRGLPGGEADSQGQRGREATRRRVAAPSCCDPRLHRPGP